MAKIDTAKLFDDPLNFWVEVWHDDETHYITVGAYARFDPALALYNRLVKPKPPMRVVMRHRAHVYRNYIPARLHNSYDRTREYPTGR